MRYSLLIPTRDRPKQLARFIDSVYRTTTHKKNIEILFAVDDDDTVSQGYVNDLISQYKPHMSMALYTRTRSDMLNDDYYNWLGKKATGDLMWILADDLEIVQYKWDEMVWQEIVNFTFKYPDKIFCISIKDNTPVPRHDMPKFPCFPMMTREAMNALGWLLFPKTPTWGADFISYCIFQPIERLLEIHNTNYINHISWHNKQVEVDATNFRVGEIFNRLKMIPHFNTDRAIKEEVPNIRLDLLQKIKDFRKESHV